MLKYIEQGLQETTAIKQHFQQDYRALDTLRASLGEALYS